MTANLVVQVAMEPKLVAVALEPESVTARLVRAGGAFAIPMLARGDRDVVRRFVKPVIDVERAADGTVTAMSGQPVMEVGPGACPSWAAAGLAAVPPPSGDELGSHDSVHRGGDRGRGRTTETESSAWRTPACTTGADTAKGLAVGDGGGRRLAVSAGRSRPQVDAQRQDAVDQLGLGVADHGEVGEVPLGLLAKAHPLGPLDRGHARVRTASAR